MTAAPSAPGPIANKPPVLLQTTTAIAPAFSAFKHLAPNSHVPLSISAIFPLIAAALLNGGLHASVGFALPSSTMTKLPVTLYVEAPNDAP